MSESTVRRRRLLTGAAILLVLAVAAFFRLWRIGDAPPGLFGDEAVNGLDALDVLAGRGRIFFPGNYGREGLHMYLIAASIKLLGVTPLAVRLPSIIAGILTAMATYWLGQELFSSEIERGKSTTVPLLAALWIATAYWHVHFSRFGIRGVFTPLFGALAFAAFWRGVNQQRAWSVENEATQPGHATRSRGSYWAWFLLSGVFLGLSIHFYTASRLYPVLLGVFLLVQAGVVWLQKGDRKGRFGSSLLGRLFWPVAGLFAVAAAVFAPLGWYFLAHPGSFAQRASTVFVFSGQESPWARVGQAIAGNLGQFFLPGRGDAAWFYNLPGRPLLEPVTALLALLGLVICLRRWKRSPYLFLLLWWPIMLVPAFLAVDRIPTAPRVLGVMPGLYFFPALAIDVLLDWLREWSLPVVARRLAAGLLLVVPLLAAAVWTARDYFVVWAPSVEAYEAFEGEAVDAAHWLQANPQPWPVYVSAEFYRHMSFMFLYSQTPTTEFFTRRDETVRWFDGRSSLPLPPADGEATLLFIGIAHTEEEKLDRYLPDRQLVYQSFDAEGKPSLTVYRAGYRNPAENWIEKPVLDGVALTGFDVYGEARPGHPLKAALFWRFDAPQPDNVAGYRIQVALMDEQGRVWSEVEKLLDYRPPEWDEGSKAVSWHQLTLPGDAPLGAYRLAVRLADGRYGTPLGEWVAFAPGEVVVGGQSEALATFGGTLRLLEAEAHLEEVPGGEQVVAELLLDVTAPMTQAYTLFLHVQDARGQRVGQRDTLTGDGLFPTDAWRPGEALRDLYRIPIEAVDVQKPYRLILGFYDWRTEGRLPATSRDGERLTDDQYVVEVRPVDEPARNLARGGE
jgi:4-amino-4-deoxy-L-arabinose transferase-like glycosyltransferase